jgi:hypothetical protein
MTRLDASDRAKYIRKRPHFSDEVIRALAVEHVPNKYVDGARFAENVRIRFRFCFDRCEASSRVTSYTYAKTRLTVSECATYDARVRVTVMYRVRARVRVSCMFRVRVRVRVRFTVRVRVRVRITIMRRSICGACNASRSRRSKRLATLCCHANDANSNPNPRSALALAVAVAVALALTLAVALTLTLTLGSAKKVNGAK